jgi:hypothetical protein
LLEEPQPLYELSIKNGKKPKPHKLKPLQTTSKVQETTTNLLEIENAYQKEIMKEIEEDITNYLDTK